MRRDSKDETDKDVGRPISAVSYTVLNCEAVTYSDVAFESLADAAADITPLRELGGTVLVLVVVLVKSVRSEDKHMSNPVSFEDLDIWPSASLFKHFPKAQVLRSDALLTLPLDEERQDNSSIDDGNAKLTFPRRNCAEIRPSSGSQVEYAESRAGKHIAQSS